MNLKKIGNVFTSKFVGTGPSSYEKRIYRAAVSRRLRNTALEDRNFLTLLKYRYVHNINYITCTVISDSRHEVDEICALLGNYAEYSGNILPTFRDRITTIGCVISQNSTDINSSRVVECESLCRWQVSYAFYFEPILEECLLYAGTKRYGVPALLTVTHLRNIIFRNFNFSCCQTVGTCSFFNKKTLCVLSNICCCS